jgi:hypothetical protein
MSIQGQINEYIASQVESKRNDLKELDHIIRKLVPECKLWFIDGKNENNKIVSNPNIGYGFQILKYADGKTKEFYKVGISANKSGISIYILSINDKEYLAKTYKDKIGKATVTGYCIKFKALKDINIEILQAAIKDGLVM